MTYFYRHNGPDLTGAALLKVEREKMDPIQYGAFVSIAYYRLSSGQTIGIVW